MGLFIKRTLIPISLAALCSHIVVSSKKLNNILVILFSCFKHTSYYSFKARIIKLFIHQDECYRRV